MTITTPMFIIIIIIIIIITFGRMATRCSKQDIARLFRCLFPTGGHKKKP